MDNNLNSDKNSTGKTIRSSSSSESVGWWQPAILIFAQVTGWIAVPIIIALYAGRWLDNKYDSEPWLFITSMIVAFIISSIGIVRVTLGYIKKIEKEAKEKKDEDNADSARITRR